MLRKLRGSDRHWKILVERIEILFILVTVSYLCLIPYIPETFLKVTRCKKE